MTVQTTPFVIYDYLQSEEDIIGFVEAAKQQAEEEKDDSILHIALLTAIKARALLRFSQKIGIDEQTLLKPQNQQQRQEVINKALMAYA